MTIEADVMKYYGFIILIFIVVKVLLFFTLWSWLKSRVTNRMVELTNKINNNEQIEDKSRGLDEFEKNPPGMQMGSQSDLRRQSVFALPQLNSTRETEGPTRERPSFNAGRFFNRDSVANAVDTVLL